MLLIPRLCFAALLCSAASLRFVCCCHAPAMPVRYVISPSRLCCLPLRRLPFRLFRFWCRLPCLRYATLLFHTVTHAMRYVSYFSICAPDETASLPDYYADACCALLIMFTPYYCFYLLIILRRAAFADAPYAMFTERAMLIDAAMLTLLPVVWFCFCPCRLSLMLFLRVDFTRVCSCAMPALRVACLLFTVSPAAPMPCYYARFARHAAVHDARHCWCLRYAVSRLFFYAMRPLIMLRYLLLLLFIDAASDFAFSWYARYIIIARCLAHMLRYAAMLLLIPLRLFDSSYFPIRAYACFALLRCCWCRYFPPDIFIFVTLETPLCLFWYCLICLHGAAMPLSYSLMFRATAATPRRRLPFCYCSCLPFRCYYVILLFISCLLLMRAIAARAAAFAARAVFVISSAATRRRRYVLYAASAFMRLFISTVVYATPR